MSRPEATSDVRNEARSHGNGRHGENGNGSRVIDLTDRLEGADGLFATNVPVSSIEKDTVRPYRLLGALLVTIDVLCLAVALLTAHNIRFGILPARGYLTGMVVGAVLWVGVFHILGLYSPHHLSGPEELRRTVSAVGIGMVMIIVLAVWFDGYLSRSWLGLTMVIALVLELATRRIVRMRVAKLQRRSLKMRTVVVGSGEQALELIDALDKPGSGFHVLGYIDASSSFITSEETGLADRVNRLRAVFRQYRPECVFLASATIGAQLTMAVVQAARQEGILVRVYTHLSGILPSRLTVVPVGEEGVALTLRPAVLSRSQRVAKRGMDLVMASLGLVLASPLLLLAAIAIKATSPGPILFRQERVTEDGRVFRMFKFRTMKDDADHYVERESIDTSVPFFKMKSDPRLTTVGRLLRKWSIDEAPQLLNVLHGDLSLVGPRPLPAEQVSANLELLGPRHEVRAGVTGWWQIQGRSDITPEEAIRMDQFYIENWSPALDFYILMRTAGALVTRKGAY